MKDVRHVYMAQNKYDMLSWNGIDDGDATRNVLPN